MNNHAYQEVAEMGWKSRSKATAQFIPGALLILASCSASDAWQTERYHDDATGRDVVVAKRRGKQDGVALTVAAKCALPDRLSFEFSTPAHFSVIRTEGKSTIPYKIGVDGQPPSARQAAFSTQDVLVIDASLPATGNGPTLDLRTAARISIQLLTPSGATTVAISPNDPGLNAVFSACGIDPSKAISLQSGADPALHRPAPSMLGQPVVKPISLKTLTASWLCSGDLGEFNLRIDNYTYQFFDDSPWGSVSGRVSIGASEAGVDNSASFPITFSGGPWDGRESPWSYTPLAGGALYYVATDTGQSQQCARS